eukprot:4218778-Amphidinium_carterae.1
MATQQFLQLQQHLELKHTTQLTRSTSLEFLGKTLKTIELQDDGSIQLFFTPEYYNKILKPYKMEKCNPSTVPGSKKPPIAGQPVDNCRQRTTLYVLYYRTSVGQLLWVSQLRVDIAYAVKELSRALQQPDNEHVKNLKQLLRHIKGTIHYRVHLAPKVRCNDRQEIKVDVESYADSDWAGCNATRKSTSGTITTCWGSPLLHISRTQSTIALSSAEAELYAMGQATIEAQHIKQVIQEMTIPMLSKDITMSIHTDSSAGKAVASRLGLNHKTKHVQLKYLYMQDIVQWRDDNHKGSDDAQSSR